MKTFFLCIALSGWIATLSGQIVPPEIPVFEDLPTNWTYRSEDTTFVQSAADSYSSPFWGRIPFDIELFDGRLYVLEQVLSQSPYGGEEGCILHCMDPQTGQVYWKYHSTTYVGSDFREKYNPTSMDFSAPGLIRLLCIRDKDSIDYTFPNFSGFNGYISESILDIHTGTLLSKKVKDSLGPDITQYQHSKLCAAGYSRKGNRRNLFSSNTDHSIFLFDVENDLDIDTSNFGEIHPGLSFDNLSTFSPGFTFIGKDTLAVLFQAWNDQDFFVKSELVITDISDLSHPVDLSRQDLTPYIPQQANDYGYFVVNTKDNNSMIFQRVKGDNSFSHYKALWFDDQFYLAAEIDTFRNSEEIYGNIYLMGVWNGEAYFACTGYSSGNLDIVKVSPGGDNTEVVKTIRMDAADLDVQFVLMDGAIKYGADQIIISLKVGYTNENDKRSSVHYYLNVDLNDLGINPLSTVDIPQGDLDMSIRPNPTLLGYPISINIISGNPEVLTIYNSLGQMLLKKTISRDSDITIPSDILDDAGLYHIGIMDRKGRHLSQRLMVIGH